MTATSLTGRLAPFLPTVGAIALALAVASVVLLPISLLTVLLAVVATAALASDRRLGPLPAALLVVLALPYDRAANNDLPRIADIPIRPQDAAIAVGLVLSLPLLRRASWSRLRTPQALSILAFLAIGVVALAVGFIGDNAARDILRDGRWWALYGVGLVAVVTGVRAGAIVRGLLAGLTVFAVAVVVAEVLPVFEGGLKLKALEFDRGLVRMQFGNTTILLVGIAAAVVASVRRPSPRTLAWLALLIVASVLSLTRVYIVVAGVVVVLATGAALIDPGTRTPRTSRLGAAILPGLTAVAAAVLAVGLVFVSLNVTNVRVAIGPTSTPGPAIGEPEEDPLDRLFLQSDESGLDTLGGGRFETYRKAIVEIAASPILGSGLGTLIRADYAFGGEPFDTPGYLPNVDNAWLTVGSKAGVVGMVAFGLVLLSGLIGALRGPRWLRVWLVPAWLGLGLLTMTQSYATTGYGPFVLGLLVVLPGLGYAARRADRARAHE